MEEEEEIDEVYNWISQMQLSNGLLESSENSNFVSLYDNTKDIPYAANFSSNLWAISFIYF